MSQRKHKVLVFTKLESFRAAAEQVCVKLQGILDDSESDAFSVELFRQDVGECDGYNSVTAVVVIDARQTRTLITPDRRDKNVDHWDELEMLRKCTKPEAMVLVVIYGDEWSKELNPEQLVAENWLTIWKFNDTKAFNLSSLERCFSIWDEFNDQQSTRIRDFITKEHLEIPSNVMNRKVVVIGSRINSCYSDDVVLETNETGKMIIQKYSRLLFNFDKRQCEEPFLTLYLYPNESPIQLYDKTETTSIESLIKDQVPDFNRLRAKENIDVVIVNTHCETSQLKQDEEKYRKPKMSLLQIFCQFIPGLRRKQPVFESTTSADLNLQDVVNNLPLISTEEDRYKLFKTVAVCALVILLVRSRQRLSMSMWNFYMACFFKSSHSISSFIFSFSKWFPRKIQ